MSKSTEPVILKAPASKSMSHRALMAAGLARGESRLKNMLDSDDLKHTRMCMAALGAEIAESGDDLLVKGVDGRIDVPEGRTVFLDVGESGTTCRLMAGIAAAGRGRFEISGRGRMHQRPIKSLEKALSVLGVRFSYKELDGCPPVVIRSSGLPGGVVDISLEDSSQYLSGVLLGTVLARSETVINVVGERIVSWPYVHLTLKIMNQFGSFPEVQILSGSGWENASPEQVRTVEPGKLRFIVHPQKLRARTYQVEGDYSNASYLLAAGAAGSQPVLVQGLDVDSAQGDRVILDILQQMGAEVQIRAEGVLVSSQGLKGVDLDMGACPDLVPTVAVLATLAAGETRIRNVAHLKIKESDRLSGVFNEISRTGRRCRMLEHGLIVEPGRITASGEIRFSTYSDHRMAMSLSLYGLAGINPVLDDSDCVNKSFPGFWKEWAKVSRAAGAVRD